MARRSPGFTLRFHIRGETMVRSALLVAFLLLFPLTGHAQVPEGVEGPFRPLAEAEEAISQLKSPYCPGFMLEVCTSEQARQLRDTIQAQALEGKTSDQLVQWMLDEYGEEYHAVPQHSGAGLWAWAAPPAAFLLGLTLVALALARYLGVGRSGREGTPAGAAAAGPAASGGGTAASEDLSDEDEALVDEALQELDRAEDADI